MPRCGWAIARRRWRPAGVAGSCSRDDAELRFREGVLLHELGRLEEAAAGYHDVLEHRDERHFSSVDRGLDRLQGAAEPGRRLPRHGRPGRGRAAVAARSSRKCPATAPAGAGWAEALVRGGRWTEASVLAERMLAEGVVPVEGVCSKSRLALLAGRVEEARAAARPGDRRIPGRPGDPARPLPVPLRARDARRGGSGAEVAPRPRPGRRLGLPQPGDAAAPHPAVRRGRAGVPAIAAVPRVLSATYLNLGYALKDSGRIGEAVAAWEQVLRWPPAIRRHARS